MPRAGDGLSQHWARTPRSSAKNLGLFRGFLASCTPEAAQHEAAAGTKESFVETSGHRRCFGVLSYLKDLAEGTIAQLAQHQPGLLGVDVAPDALAPPRRLLLLRKAKKPSEKSHGATSMQRKPGQLGWSSSTKRLRSLHSPHSSSSAGRKGLSTAPDHAGCAEMEMLCSMPVASCL